MNKTLSHDHSPAFTIKVAKRPDGQFAATAPAHPSISPIVAATSNLATSRLIHEIQAATRNHKLTSEA